MVFREVKYPGHYDFILWEIFAMFLCIGTQPSQGLPSKDEQKQEVNIMNDENPITHIKVKNIR